MRRSADAFGNQAIVVAVDARRDPAQPGRWEVFTHGGRKPTGIDAVAWCERMAAAGAGEILLTSMDRDGTRDGFDIELTRAVADRVPVPVIASGGVGNLQHLYEGIADGRADAVLAASIFHFGEYTVGQAHDYQRARGVSVREAWHEPRARKSRQEQHCSRPLKLDAQGLGARSLHKRLKPAPSACSRGRTARRWS